MSVRNLRAGLMTGASTIALVALVCGLSISAKALVIPTTDGLITVTPGTTTFGEVGKYISGGTGLVGIAGSWPSGPAPAVAASAIDHYWLQGGDGTSPLTWEFTNPTNSVIVFAGIDHGPAVPEALEYILWGSNDKATWEKGKITGISGDGWDSANTAIGHSDDNSGIWGFSSSYKYFQATAGDHLIPTYGSDDLELDGVASTVPEPGVIAMFSGSILGFAGFVLRRRK